MYAAIYLFQRILNSFVMQNGFDKTGSNDVVSYDTSEVTKRFFFYNKSGAIHLTRPNKAKTAVHGY